MIDIEALVIAWLNVDPVGVAHAASQHPRDLDANPWIRVHLIDDRAMDETISHSDAMLQLDCYASREGGQGEAIDVASAALRRLKTMTGLHPQGVVSSITGIARRRLPDTAMNPARERYIIEANVFAHDLP